MTRPSVFMLSRRARSAAFAAGAPAAALGMVPKAKAGNKFGAKKSQCGAGHVHDSKIEARRCDQLHLLQRGGVISDLTHQPQYWFVIDGVAMVHENGRRVGYRADFSYVEAGAQIVEDVKGGYDDHAWPLRKALFRALHPNIILKEVTA
jgi:hypothetical protein